jgi:YHS domain-containing protein
MGNCIGECNAQSRSALCMQSQSGGTVEKDVVCGMEVDPAKAAGTSHVNGKTYYFCSKGCKATFDADPARYTK